MRDASSALNAEEIKRLITRAVSMLMRSYTPYSGYTVGAALLCEDGTVYTGCNIENAAFTPTICAERTAFFKAISEGKKKFVAIAVVGGKNGVAGDSCTPCGVCRQVMMEFCNPDQFQVVMAQNTANYRIKTLGELLPDGFGPASLED